MVSLFKKLSGLLRFQSADENGNAMMFIEPDDESFCEREPFQSAPPQQRPNKPVSRRRYRFTREQQQQILQRFFPSSILVEDDREFVGSKSCSDLCSASRQVPKSITFEAEQSLQNLFQVGGMQLDDEYKPSWHTRTQFLNWQKGEDEDEDNPMATDAPVAFRISDTDSLVSSMSIPDTSRLEI